MRPSGREDEDPSSNGQSISSVGFIYGASSTNDSYDFLFRTLIFSFSEHDGKT